MGLDMYLYKEIYVGAQHQYNNVEGEIKLSSNNKPINVNFKKVSTITEQICYWRKANHIHQYFVNVIGNGVDDCKPIYVDTDDLRVLLDICKEVKNNPNLASEKLPTRAGFFFGGTEYDESYMQDIIDTINFLEEEINDVNNNDILCDYEYQASW